MLSVKSNTVSIKPTVIIRELSLRDLWSDFGSNRHRGDTKRARRRGVSSLSDCAKKGRKVSCSSSIRPSSFSLWMGEKGARVSQSENYHMLNTHGIFKGPSWGVTRFWSSSEMEKLTSIRLAKIQWRLIAASCIFTKIVASPLQWTSWLRNFKWLIFEGGPPLWTVGRESRLQEDLKLKSNFGQFSNWSKYEKHQSQIDNKGGSHLTWNCLCDYNSAYQSEAVLDVLPL